MLKIGAGKAVREVSVGIFLGIIVTVIAVSLSSMIFSGLLASHIQLGITTGLIGAVLILLVVSLRSSSPIVIAAPQDTYAIIATIVAASIASQLSGMGQSHAILPTVIASMILLSLSTGILMYGVGRLQLGYLIRFLPFTVFSGFFTGTGWLILIGAIHSLIPLNEMSHWLAYFEWHYLQQWIWPLGLALLIFLIELKTKNALAFALGFCFALLAFYLYLFIYDISFVQASEKGWMLELYANSKLQIPSTEMMGQINWLVLAAHWQDYITVAVLSVISALLNISGFELLTNQKIRMDHELRAVGVSNFACALFGAQSGWHYVSISMINKHFRSKTRLAAIVCAFTCLGFLVLGSNLLAYMPKFVFATLLMYIAIGFIYQWLIKKIGQVSRLDFLIILGISFIILFYSIFAGLVVGAVVAGILFMVKFSKISTVRLISDAAYLHSNVERTQLETEILETHGNKILLVRLLGYLFFGNADYARSEIINQIESRKQDHIEYLIIDLSKVSGYEISGIISLAKLIYFCTSQNIAIVTTHMPEDVENRIKQYIGEFSEHKPMLSFLSFDRALEYCENQILYEYYTEDMKKQSSVQHQFSETRFEHLLAYGEQKIYLSGDVIFKEGDPSDSMYWIQSGILEVILNYGEETEQRLQKVGDGVFLGEVGVFSDKPRTATVVAIKKCIVYKLTLSVIEKIAKEDPELLIELLKVIVKILTKRLTGANKIINSMSS